MLFCILFFLFSSLDAKIIQTNRMEDVLSHINENTWVLFDLDDTLMEGENQLGRAKWYWHETQKMIAAGCSSYDAQQLFYPQWILSQMICPFRTPEAQTTELVAKIQKIASRVMGLTARHPPIAAVTVEQLQKLGINLGKTAPVFLSKEIATPYQTVYRDGIWFLTDYNQKGKCFALFLDAAAEAPKRIVFVDDGRHHLEDMDKALTKKNIEFIGIHYTKAIERPFNAEIADLQYKRLPEILSDEEAAIELGRKSSSLAIHSVFH